MDGVNEKEYRLNGNAFKILQYLKTKPDDTQADMSKFTGIHLRNISRCIVDLKYFKIIKVSRESKRKGNTYTINGVEKWTI